MSVTTVYEALNNAIVNESINLWNVSADPALPGLRGVLELFGISSAYSLDNAVLGQGQGSVTLTGKGMFGQPGDPGGMRFHVSGTLLYVESQGDFGVFRLTLAITDSGWSFSSFFNENVLPECQKQDPAKQAIFWVHSFLAGLRLNSPSFSADSRANARLALSGLLPEAEVFGPYMDFIKPWPLTISGELTMPATWDAPPAMTLTAMAASGSGLPIGSEPDLSDGPRGIALKDLGLQLKVCGGLDPEVWGRTAFSTLNLIGTVVLGDQENGLVARLFTPLLASGATWHLTAVFDRDHASLVRGMAQLTTIFGLPALPLPDNFPLIDTFKFRTVELYFSTPLKKDGDTGSIPVLKYLAISIGSDQVWTPPIPFVKIHDVGTRWVWGWSYADKNGKTEVISTVSGSVYGTFNFGGTGGAGGGTLPALPSPSAEGSGVDIDVAVQLPDLFINGGMRQGDYIPIGRAFTYFFGEPGPPVAPDRIANVTALAFSADPIGQTYAATAGILFGDPASPDPEQGWHIDLVIMTVTLKLLSFWINVNAGKVGGGISGVFSLEDGSLPTDETKPRLMLQAEYPVQDPETPTGWTFSGYLYPGTSIDLTNLVARFLGLERAPASVPHLTVDRLVFSFSTGTKAYKLGGTISARWTPEIFDTPLKITASASIDIGREGSSDPDQPATGRLSGLFSVNRISIEAAMDVGVEERTYLFKVHFGELWFQATTSWRGEKGDRHQAISLQLGGVTLGEIIEYLVNLAAPTLGYTLDAPWDVLKRIELSRFVLTIDPHDNLVEFVFRADVDLTIARIDTVGVRYTRGGAGKVDLILEGNFLGKEYQGDDALAWDVVNDPPPAVPGQGTALVDLRYLGIGQRIRIRNPPDTVAENIALLKKFMLPVKDPKNLPAATGPVAFSSDSQWLIGLDLSLMSGTVDLGFLFNDPVLYGLSVALGGEKAGSLAGLRFEILYKKITNDIGMFRVELRVPDAFRTFQIGVASVTLGIVVVEIYTNGNFMVDLGFPWNRNFDRSFSLQAYVFIGRGGFYLGVLNGATSRNVPRITNGNFSPVLELGIGIAAGVGREIRAGILAGGAYVQIEVIFQGVLGWFNPTSQGTAPAQYFRAQGIVAIHGKVYGYVDFKIIKVSVLLEAYAQVSALFECYRPTVFLLEAEVRAEAEVKILFFTISFSFHVGLEIGFTLGRVEQTPWILAPDQGAGQGGLPLSHHMPRNSAHETRVLMAHHMRNLNLAAGVASGAETAWGWNPDKKLFPDGQPRTAHLTLLPLFTVGDPPVTWTSPSPGAEAAPRYRSAFILCADSGASPEAKTAAATRQRSASLSPMSAGNEDTGALTPDLLTRVFLLYALYSIPNGPAQEDDPVTSGQLALLAQRMDDPATADDGFALRMLEKIFANNLHLAISGDPGGTPSQLGGMIAPLPPYLSWVSPQGGDIDFATVNRVGPWYEWGVSKLMEAYLSVGGNVGERPETDDPARYESFPAYLFRDYCLMIARSAVKEAQTLMENAVAVVGKHRDGSIQSLADLAGTFPSVAVDYRVRSGDTVQSVAQALGATAPELEFLNPGLQTELDTASVGSTIGVRLGIAPETLAMDNSGEPFAPTEISLGTVPHQVAAGETLSAIAALFHVGDPATFFEDAAHVSTGLGSNPDLLLRNAPFDYPAKSWNSDVTLIRAAALFFGRYTLPSLSQAAWYAQAVFDLNRSLMARLYPGGSVPIDLELPPGQSLTIPAAFNDLTRTTTYVTVAGDTLNRIGLTLTLEQVYPADSPPQAPEWQTFRSLVTAVSPNVFAIPGWHQLFVVSGETLESLSRRLIADTAWTGTDPGDPRAGSWRYDWTGIVRWAGPAAILAPLAVVPVPGAIARAETGKTLSFDALAATYGIPVPDAAGRLQDIGGLFAENTSLRLSLLPVQSVARLVEGVLSGEGPARIVNQASRWLMAGLRLPAPAIDEQGHTVPSTTVTLPLLDLSGQQFDTPVNGDPGHSGDVALTLSVSSHADWITLMNSTTVGADDTRDSLLARHPELLAHSPGLKEARLLAAGMVALTSPAPTLEYRYTNGDIIANGPATSLVVPLAAPPRALPLSGEAPRTYGLDQRVEIQTPVQLPIPGTQTPPLSGQPSLWAFSEDLLQRARTDGTTPYEILSIRRETAAGRHAGEVTAATWGCLISFDLRKTDASLKLFNLLGVDNSQRPLLLELKNWLATDGSGKTAAFLLTAPAPNAGNSGGLTVLTASPEAFHLIKSNLSTESVPQPPELLRVSGANPPPLYYASLSSLADFLTLLWEGSVVGGTGYYAGTTSDLPASAFDDRGTISLRLLVIAGTQQDVAPTGRPLLPFNTCALAGPGLDGGLHSLFVESYDDSDTIRQALAPPGNAGFTLETRYPADVADPTEEKEVMLRKLYSLLSFSIPPSGASPFAAPPSGMGIPPQPADAASLPRWQKERLLRRNLLTDDRDSLVPKPFWRYDQLLPLYNFAPASPLPAVSGLPPSEEDPYRGFGTASTCATATFRLGFGDALGNRTAQPAEGEGSVPVPVGYTDPLIGVMQWPSIACSYAVDPAATGGVTLSVAIAPRPSTVVPSPSRPGAAAADEARQQAQKYAASYYQLGQSITGRLVTTLRNDAGPDALKIDVSLPWRFAAGGYAFSSAASRLESAFAPPGATPEQLCSAYNVRYAEMAAANSESLISDLFGNASLAVPAFVTFAEHDTAITLAAATRPPGWPAPKAEAILADPDNGHLPLRVGALLKIGPPAQFTTGAAPATLAEVSAFHGTTPALLAADNANVMALMEGFVFSVAIDDNLFAEVTVTSSTATDPIDTLQRVSAAFAKQGVNVTPADLATLHAGRHGLLAPDKTLSSSVWVARDGESLARNGSGLNQDELSRLNVLTPDLFDAGALVYLGRFGNGAAVQPDPLLTLRQFAASYACPPELLLAANAHAAIPEGNRFAIPGLIAWPKDAASLRIPYTIHQGDTLNAVAGRFMPAGTGENRAVALADANAGMPETLAGNLTLDLNVGGRVVTVTTAAGGAPFGAVLAQAQGIDPAATMADLVAAMGDMPGALRPERLLICPPCSLPGDCAPENIPGLYTIDASLFALANAAAPGLIVPGLAIYSPDGNASVTTAAGDTFNSLIVRFAGQNVRTDAAGIATAPKNLKTPFLASGAMALLPPAPIRPAADMGPGGPYPGPIFPLSVTLRLERPSALIHPDFDPGAHGPVERADSLIPAPVREQGSGGQSSLTLNAFVASMRTALPALRMATAKTGASGRDLWAVNFGEGGIEELTVKGGTTVPGQTDPQPRFFALKPLYNTLVTRSGVAINDLTADGGLSPAAVPTDFQGIDVEVWAGRFLADMDRFLTASFCNAMYADASLRPYLSSVLDSKAMLTEEIPSGLAVILDIADPLAEAGLVRARETLKQQLGISLSKAYGVSVMLQFDRVVRSPWQRDSSLPPADLYGAVKPVDAAGNGFWTMTAAKTHLDDSNPFVTFLMTVTDPASRRSVTSNMEYDVPHAEFNVSTQGVPENYVSSDWLCFVPPLAGTDRPATLKTDLGTVTAPIPLRNFPALPIVLGQSAATSGASDSLARQGLLKGDRRDGAAIPINRTPLWDYAFTYSHQHAEQDDVAVVVRFNLQRGLSACRNEEPKDLFTELARYVAVADRLWPMLEGLATPAGPENGGREADSASTGRSVATFATLAANVAACWNGRLSPAFSNAAASIAAASFAFRARVTDRDSPALGRELDYLTLTREGDSPGPAGEWPLLFCLKPDGGRQPLTAVPVGTGGTAVDYRVPPDVSIPVTWPVFTLEWHNLNVSQWQNATGKVSVERNCRLLGRAGPETDAGFVFKTDEVQASGVATPLNVWSERIPMEGTAGPDYVKTALDNAFEALFPTAMQAGGEPLKITVGISYAYELVPNPRDPALSLVSEVPVALYPDKLLDASTAGVLQDAVNSWKTANKPNEKGGEWVFSLTLYSSMEEEKRPLLVVERMFCGLGSSSGRT